jgi:hypothetical protein
VSQLPLFPEVRPDRTAELRRFFAIKAHLLDPAEQPVSDAEYQSWFKLRSLALGLARRLWPDIEKRTEHLAELAPPKSRYKPV